MVKQVKFTFKCTVIFENMYGENENINVGLKKFNIMSHDILHGKKKKI